MSSRSSWSYLWLLAVLDGVALRWAWPHPIALGHHLADPHQWVATVGADSAAAALAGAALWCAAAWFALGLGAVALIRLPGVGGGLARRTAQALLPGVLYRVLAGAAGLGVVLAPIAAMAAPAPLPAPTIPVLTAPANSTLLPAPTLPRAPAARPPTAAPSPPGLADLGKPAARHVVRSGECLWRIAEDELGPRSTPARIAAAWPRIYAANRTVIGSDPALIRPGEALHLPDAQPQPAEAVR